MSDRGDRQHVVKHTISLLGTRMAFRVCMSRTLSHSCTEICQLQDTHTKGNNLVQTEDKTNWALCCLSQLNTRYLTSCLGQWLKAGSSRLQYYQAYCPTENLQDQQVTARASNKIYCRKTMNLCKSLGLNSVTQIRKSTFSVSWASLSAVASQDCKR